MAGLRTITEVGPTDARVRLVAGEAVALDVRELDEWECGRIEGAVHIPVGELTLRREELPTGVPIIAVCRSGSRSAYATQLLVSAGYRTENLAGGMQAWHAAGLPLDPPAGFVA